MFLCKHHLIDIRERKVCIIKTKWNHVLIFFLKYTDNCMNIQKCRHVMINNILLQETSIAENR